VTGPASKSTKFTTGTKFNALTGSLTVAEAAKRKKSIRIDKHGNRFEVAAMEIEDLDDDDEDYFEAYQDGNVYREGKAPALGM